MGKSIDFQSFMLTILLGLGKYYWPDVNNSGYLQYIITGIIRYVAQLQHIGSSNN